MDQSTFAAITGAAWRQFHQTWKFEGGLVQSVDATSGGIELVTAGRPSARTQLAKAYEFDARSGDRMIVLGSTRSELPVVMGTSPWVTG